MSASSAAETYGVRSDVPSHVPASLVYRYNVFSPGPSEQDIFESLYELKKQAPPVFWTPYNGGHWFTADGTLARQVLADSERFSSQVLMLQRQNNPPKGQGFTPIHLDPPEHTVWRQLLLKALSRKTVVDMLPHMHTFTVDLIERLKPKGECEFIAEVAYLLPTQVFVLLVDLPEKYLDGLRWRVAALHDIAADKAKLFQEIEELLLPFVQERMANPGDDLVSWLSRQEVDGKPVSEKRLHSITALLTAAALGTIADTYGCIFRYLADHPERREWIRANPSKINGVVEELLRRFPIILAGTARLCVQDAKVGDALIKADDIMLATPAMMNFEPKTYQNPLEVDFDRHIAENGTFGHGPHRCAGAALTRALLKILIEEWLQRIPDFEVSKKEPSIPLAAVNVCYERMVLKWPV